MPSAAFPGPLSVTCLVRSMGTTIVLLAKVSSAPASHSRDKAPSLRVAAITLVPLPTLTDRCDRRTIASRWRRVAGIQSRCVPNSRRRCCTGRAATDMLAR